MPVKIKNNANWQDLGIPMTRVSGEWKPCKQVWTRVNNEWKKVFDLELADDFNGTGNLDNQFTPGHSKWKVYRGSFTKNGSGNVTAGSLNSVAGIETGTDKNIELQIDPGSASESGTGVAFWIQDQSNWWGAQSFYQAYSFSNSPVTGSNFYSCTFTNYTATKNTNAGTPSGVNFIGTTNSSLTPTGSSFQQGTKTCQGGRWTAFSLDSSGCTGSCTETGVPFNTPCSPNGATRFVRNCGPAGGCTNCANTTFPTNFSSGSIFSCPLPFSNSSSVCGGTGSLSSTTNYACTPFAGTPGTFANCDHSASPGGTFATNIFSFDNRGYTDTTCSPASSASCVK